MKKEKCAVKGCKKYQDIAKHKLCHAHYQRLRRHGDVGTGALKSWMPHPPYKPQIVDSL